MDQLMLSIAQDPELMDARPILVNSQLEVFAGNQRLRACIALGWKEVPCHVLDWSEEKQKRAMIKDNVSAGEWDTDMLANDEWELEDLKEWGVPIDWDKPESEDKPKEPKQCDHCEKMIP